MRKSAKTSFDPDQVALAKKHQGTLVRIVYDQSHTAKPREVFWMDLVADEAMAKKIGDFLVDLSAEYAKRFPDSESTFPTPA